MFMCRLRHIAALPLRATPPLPFTAGAPTETAFSLEKKSAGEISKMQRLFLAGRSTACRAKRRGLVQHFVLK